MIDQEPPADHPSGNHVTLRSGRNAPKALLVRGGTYTESEIWQRDEYGDSGTATARSLIKASPGETVLMTNGARPWILSANYITVSRADRRCRGHPPHRHRGGRRRL